MHKKNMRTTGNIRMNGHRKDKLIILTIEVIEMILRDGGQHQILKEQGERKQR